MLRHEASRLPVAGAPHAEVDVGLREVGGDGRREDDARIDLGCVDQGGAAGPKVLRSIPID
ncbi:hypothetical protein A0J59_14615 [Cellulosimicrobium sp. I38E]|nr:hypothetical protein A0J59_14615 [Cellulosimicrobium sp. I38E]